MEETRTCSKATDIIECIIEPSKNKLRPTLKTQMTTDQPVPLLMLLTQMMMLLTQLLRVLIQICQDKKNYILKN